jgi:GR25 family glycosyltransferase involved in LPS biosynthesis
MRYWRDFLLFISLGALLAAAMFVQIVDGVDRDAPSATANTVGTAHGHGHNHGQGHRRIKPARTWNNAVDVSNSNMGTSSAATTEGQQSFKIKSKHKLHVFYINLKRDTHRRQYMESLLGGMPDVISHRVEAVSPTSEDYNIILLEKPCKRNSPHDLSVILSHLKAIHAGLSATSAEVALVLEDDVRLLYGIDVDALVDSAPKSFGILQLVTSNVEAIDMLWTTFQSSSGKSLWTQNNWNDMTKDRKTTLFWSAQAYIVNISHVRSFIEDVIEVDSTGKLGFKIVNSFFPDRCTRTKSRPCVVANCLFSDSYIYAGGGPTFVSHIPLFNGANISLVSSLHQDHVVKHQAAFNRIDEIALEVKEKYMTVGTAGGANMGQQAISFIF